METIGSRIRHLRNLKELSMEELSKQIWVPEKHNSSTKKNITSATISNIENDKNSPSADIIIALSEFFSVSCDWILTGKEFKSNETIELSREETTLVIDELEHFMNPHHMPLLMELLAKTDIALQSIEDIRTLRTDLLFKLGAKMVNPDIDEKVLDQMLENNKRQKDHD